MPGSIQFKGEKAILEAYDNNDVAAWAIFEGKRMMVKHTERDFLEAYLKNLQECGTNATYTLKVYEDITDRKQIKETTPCDGSFNFKVFTFDEYEQVREQHPGVQRYNGVMAQEIREIKEQLQQVLSERTNEEPSSRLGIIGEIMESPLGPYVGQIIQNWLAPAGRTLSAAVGNLPPSSTAGNGATDLQGIINGLRQHDPRINEHLAKLLKIATDDLPSFQFLIKTLDQM